MEAMTEVKNNYYCRDAYAATLTKKDFDRLSGFIYSVCGIKMPPPKKVMLEARLRKRLRALEMSSFADYCDFVLDPEGMEREAAQMIDAVTTNKTEFFREPGHFDFLAKNAVPELQSLHGAGRRRKLFVWSAGCSSGEEPYSLAMVLSGLKEKTPELDFSVFATDISTKVLSKAVRAVYDEARVGDVPHELKRKYLMRSKDRGRRLVRIAPELREKVRFSRLNLMDEDYGMAEPVDVIFCRNVIIYFDRPTQERLLNRLCRHLVPGGYMFMGHSETLSGLKVPLVSVGSMVYRRPL